MILFSKCVYIEIEIELTIEMLCASSEAPRSVKNHLAPPPEIRKQL